MVEIADAFFGASLRDEYCHNFLPLDGARVPDCSSVCRQCRIRRCGGKLCRGHRPANTKLFTVGAELSPSTFAQATLQGLKRVIAMLFAVAWINLAKTAAGRRPLRSGICCPHSPVQDRAIPNADLRRPRSAPKGIVLPGMARGTAFGWTPKSFSNMNTPGDTRERDTSHPGSRGPPLVSRPALRTATFA